MPIVHDNVSGMPKFEIPANIANDVTREYQGKWTRTSSDKLAYKLQVHVQYVSKGLGMVLYIHPNDLLVF